MRSVPPRSAESALCALRAAAGSTCIVCYAAAGATHCIVSHRSEMGAGVSARRTSSEHSQAVPKRLFLYTERSAALPRLEASLVDNIEHCVSVQYEYGDWAGTSGARAVELVALVQRQVWRHGRFLSVAIAPLGPMHQPEGTAEGEDCRWQVSQSIVLTNPSDLLQRSHPMRVVMEALGHATIAGGRVDLLSCGMLRTWACPEHVWPRLLPLAAIEEATQSTFAASEHMCVGDPLDGDGEWPMESDATVDIRALYLRAPAAAAVPSDGRDGSERSHSVEGSVAPGALLQSRGALHQQYALGPSVRGTPLGRGSFARMRYATRRAPVAAAVDSKKKRLSGHVDGLLPRLWSGLSEGGRLQASCVSEAEVEEEVMVAVIGKARCHSMQQLAAEVRGCVCPPRRCIRTGLGGGGSQRGMGRNTYWPEDLHGTATRAVAQSVCLCSVPSPASFDRHSLPSCSLSCERRRCSGIFTSCACSIPFRRPISSSSSSSR